MDTKKDNDTNLAGRLNRIKNTKPVELPPATPRVERSSKRYGSYKIARIIDEHGGQIPCVIKNINAQGAYLSFSLRTELPAVFTLMIEGSKQSSQARLIWQKEDEAGVAFL